MKIKKIIVGPLQTNYYFLKSGFESAVIDPGGNFEKIIDLIEKKEAKLKYIVNTHFHSDHTVANQELKKATGAWLLIHEAEKNFIDFSADRYLRAGDKIKIGAETLEVLHTPGHSPGSICLQGNNFVITGFKR